MKKEEINNKILVIVMILIGILLSVRFMLNFYSIYTFYYLTPIRAKFVGVFKDDKMFTSSFLLGVVGTIIGIVMLVYVFKLKKNKDRISLGRYAILMGLGINLLFYVINPWYTLQTHPRLFLYQDGINITNKERYFFFVEKYGFDSTLYKPFKTLDESIEGLEFAKKNNEPGLYNSIFYDLERFGYDKVFEKYDDLTFQAYFLSKITSINTYYKNQKEFFLNNIKYLNYLERNLNNITIKDVLNYIKSEYTLYNNGLLNEEEFYKNINEYGDKVYDIKGIHSGMFSNTDKLYKYKKNNLGNRELINKN